MLTVGAYKIFDLYFSKKLLNRSPSLTIYLNFSVVFYFFNPYFRHHTRSSIVALKKLSTILLIFLMKLEIDIT